MTVRKPQQRRGWAFSLAVAIVKPLLLATTTRDWRHAERIPATGGCVIALNHISHVDPLTAAHIVYDHGRLPRYLAKSNLFRHRALRFLMHGLGQIPVERDGRGAIAYAAAVAAVQRGECVVVYPEGTITRDPDLWPMTGKTGAARISLETGCPVLPVGQWGAQLLLPPYSRKPRLFPRSHVVMSVGEPVDLEDLRSQEPTLEVVRQASERILAAITAQLEEIRGERAPEQRYDMRVSGDPYRDREHRGSRDSHGDHHGHGHGQGQGQGQGKDRRSA